MKNGSKFVVALVMAILILQVPLSANAYSNISSYENTIKDDVTQNKDIVEILSSDKRFKTLNKALDKAGLIDTLKGEGPFTIFAPTDDAFAKLEKGMVKDLLKPANKKILSDLLTFHVAKGKVKAEEAKKLDGKEITMANDKKAKITVKDGSIYINNAKVIMADIEAKNGIIHVIDAVIIP